VGHILNTHTHTHTHAAETKANNPHISTYGPMHRRLLCKVRTAAHTHRRKDRDKPMRQGGGLRTKLLPLTLLSSVCVCVRARVCLLPRVDRLCVFACVQTGRDGRPPGTGWTILRQAGGAQRGRATGKKTGKRVSE